MGTYWTAHLNNINIYVDSNGCREKCQQCWWQKYMAVL